MSDRVPAFTLKGLGQSIANGDLPNTTFFCQNLLSGVITQRTSDCLVGEKLSLTTGGVNGLSSPLDADLATDGEGTAMLEIVRDLAPGAALYFVGTTGNTSVDYAQALDALGDNVDIVVSDIAQPMFFPDGQSLFSQV